MSEILPSQLLTAEHRAIDDALTAILHDATGTEQPAVVAEQLCRHLYVEEEVLFPLVADALAMPIYIMQYEHGQMWPFVQRLGRADTVRESSRKLLQLLEVHNPKEEDVLYAAFDRLAEAEQADQLIAAVRAASVPADWLCKAKRDDFAPPPGAPAWEPPPEPL